MSARPQLALLALLAAAGCGGGGGGTPDAGPDPADAAEGLADAGGPDGGGGPCPGAPTVELGIPGDDGSFGPVPATVAFVAGPQGGYFVDVVARAMGLAPGDPDDFFAPGNPETRFALHFFDGSVVPLETTPGITLGYRPGEGGWCDLANSRLIEMIPTGDFDAYRDTDATLTVEFEDALGATASDEASVHIAQDVEEPRFGILPFAPAR